tara:strand:- start:111 stop:824 length:714 start_codon:yes stop_codon:yes gene_type:complete
MNILQELVNEKSVAIVGPSPHLEGQKLGKLIDSYDLVCRLNEVMPIDLQEDYGSRTDLVFWNLASEALKDFRQMIYQDKKNVEKIQLIVCPRHSRHTEPQHISIESHDNNIFKNFKSLKLKNNFFHIGDEKNISLEKQIGCHPTVGTLAISTLMNCNLKDLFICGISFYKTHKRYNSSLQQTLTAANNGITPNFCFAPPGHDVEKEIDFLQNEFIRYKYLKCKNIGGDQFFKNIFNL